MEEIKTLCLTGGPCSGKSTALPYLAEKLGDRGFYPVIIPEAATLLMQSGITPAHNLFDTATFQDAIIRLIKSLEKTARHALRRSACKNPIILCDRGIPDCLAYMPEDVYIKTLRSHGLGSHIEVRDGRYVGVFHLRTAALGAEEFYTLENNTVRRETVAEAREKDAATLNAWTGHPHLRVIDNSTGFGEKLKRLEKDMYRTLGVPVPLEIERKYLVDHIDPRLIPVPYQTIDIEQFYLDSDTPNVEVRMRKRGQYGHYVYYRTEKRPVRTGVRIETERFIDEMTYLRGLERKRPNSHSIVKKRICFIYENKYFELDYMSKPKQQCYLEIELTEENEDHTLPPFLKGVVDITGDSAHSNFGIATRI